MKKIAKHYRNDPFQTCLREVCMEEDTTHNNLFLTQSKEVRVDVVGEFDENESKPEENLSGMYESFLSGLHFGVRFERKKDDYYDGINIVEKSGVEITFLAGTSTITECKSDRAPIYFEFCWYEKNQSFWIEDGFSETDNHQIEYLKIGMLWCG